MKQLPVIFIALISLLLSSYSTRNASLYSLKTVVIDAGHGGHDTGCLGSSAREKAVTLAIALKLGKYIEENFKDVKVIYTRKTDVFVELYERAAIANRNNADLFISIHCNSGPKAAYGTETFVMGLHRTDDNLSVAKRENSSVLLEKDYELKYDGFDPKSPESHIIFSLYQNTFLHQSLSFASKVEDQFAKESKRNSRGVKQAGFLVLYKTTMPSVLIETGFLTNSNEHNLLASANGQNEVARDIYNAFREFKSSMETSASANNEPVSRPLASKEPVIVSSGTNKAGNSKSDVFFTVQFATSAKPLPTNSARFAKAPAVRMEKSGNIYKFLSGKFDSLGDAQRAQSDLRKAGFTDSFVVGYNGNKRITVAEAQSLIKKN